MQTMKVWENKSWIADAYLRCMNQTDSRVNEVWDLASLPRCRAFKQFGVPKTTTIFVNYAVAWLEIEWPFHVDTKSTDTFLLHFIVLWSHCWDVIAQLSV